MRVVRWVRERMCVGREEVGERREIFLYRLC